MSAQRKGDWMQTFSGQAFWPLDPRADEIELIDIAHSLSMQCRYAGHCRHFYSVAEHSVLIARAMPNDDLARIALLHDATEAYMVDLPRPVKNHMRDYKAAEIRLWRIIAERFNLPICGSPVVDAADNRILLDEMSQLMAKPPKPWDIPGTPEPLGVTIMGWSPASAKTEFLQTANRLGLWDERGVSSTTAA